MYDYTSYTYEQYKLEESERRQNFKNLFGTKKRKPENDKRKRQSK